MLYTAHKQPNLCMHTYHQRRIHVSPEGFDLETEQAPELVHPGVPQPDDPRRKMEQAANWEHLVGKDGEEAKAEILRDFPHYTVSFWGFFLWEGRFLVQKLT